MYEESSGGSTNSEEWRPKSDKQLKENRLKETLVSMFSLFANKSGSDKEIVLNEISIVSSSKTPARVVEDEKELISKKSNLIQVILYLCNQMKENSFRDGLSKEAITAFECTRRGLGKLEAEVNDISLERLEEVRKILIKLILDNLTEKGSVMEDLLLKISDLGATEKEADLDLAADDNMTQLTSGLR